ncbi:kinesin-like protein KIN-14I isoform X3 [Corylus avellana]|uniref:kinesin-like protein KIN-14I isoform X3 n=1 Tax=Corylus avellana TaxID=13451 RepID=UPI00286CA730|nr:kinesin-like protein KIN-14I isoform X3 [Corylus avellana]XP_059437824.1 kinesin-like protein KIN-14I isoform X3 [Corylus avellana]
MNTIWHITCATKQPHIYFLKLDLIPCLIYELKSYSEWKQTGGNGVWKFGGNVKPTVSAKSFVRKNSEPFTNSLSRNSSTSEKSLNVLSSDIDFNKMPPNGSLSMLVRAVLLDKKPDEVPMAYLSLPEGTASVVGLIAMIFPVQYFLAMNLVQL